MVGVCGGFTTFSAFSFRPLNLLRSGAWIQATVNILVSAGLCIGAVAVGHSVAAYFNDGATLIAQLDIEEECLRGHRPLAFAFEISRPV